MVQKTGVCRGRQVDIGLSQGAVLWQTPAGYFPAKDKENMGLGEKVQLEIGYN